MKKKKNKIWLIGVVLLGLLWGMFQLPVVKDGLFDLQTKMVNRELIAHSVGMNDYYLGQILSEEELDGWRQAQQCMTDDPIADEAGIPWAKPYSSWKTSMEISFIGLREIADSEEMFQIVELISAESSFELYGIKKETDRSISEKILKKEGFQKKYSGYSIDDYWKAGIRIRLSIWEEKVSSIRLHLHNRKEYEAMMKVIEQKKEN